MQNKFKIIDNSADKIYFTMVPNYIVNHSTVYEQAIYLYMKRVAGEHGTCWSSAQSIAKKLSDPNEKRKVSRNTIAKYRDKLVKRGWIKLVGYKGKTKPTPEYSIVDIWPLNMDHYAKESSSHEQSKESATGDEIVQPVNLESARGGHKEEPNKEKPNKKNPVEGFDEFWKAYPRKIGKPAAQRAWRTLKPNKEAQGKILQGIERWIQTEQWKKANGQFIPHPSTFLNQRRWEDTPTPDEKKPYFFDQPMKKINGRWFVSPTGGGELLEFAGEEKEIVWR